MFEKMFTVAEKPKQISPRAPIHVTLKYNPIMMLEKKSRKRRRRKRREELEKVEV